MHIARHVTVMLVSFYLVYVCIGNTPRRQHTKVATHQGDNTPRWQHTKMSTHQGVNTPRRQHTNVSTHQGGNTPRCQHTKVSTHQGGNTPRRQQQPLLFCVSIHWRPGLRGGHIEVIKILNGYDGIGRKCLIKLN